MTPRTKQEVKDEITALQALRPVGPFARKTQASINEAISELQGPPFDDTSEEWNELPDNIRDLIQHTKEWVAGGCKDGPSKGWGGLVA